jgi:glutaredoxin
VTQAAVNRPIVYTTTWCGYCYRLKRQLDRAGIGVTEIDIEHNPSAAAVVERLNHGDQTVPTVVFPRWVGADQSIDARGRRQAGLGPHSSLSHVSRLTKA